MNKFHLNACLRVCLKYLHGKQDEKKHITKQHHASELACNGLSCYSSTFLPILSIEPSRQQVSILCVLYIYICPYYPLVRILSLALMKNILQWLEFHQISIHPSIYLPAHLPLNANTYWKFLGSLATATTHWHIMYVPKSSKNRWGWESQPQLRPPRHKVPNSSHPAIPWPPCRQAPKRVCCNMLCW